MHDLRYQEVLSRLSELKLAIAWLKPLNEEPDKIEPSLSEIVNLVCKTYRVPRGELISHRKSNHIVWPRHVAMYLCYTLTRHSLPSLGTYFAGFDHTSVLHARKKVARLRQEKPEIEAQLRRLETLLVGEG